MLRCINDFSDDENTPPNTKCSKHQGTKDGFSRNRDETSKEDIAATGTSTLPWLSPGRTKRYSRTELPRTAPTPPPPE
ncbi:hypothetical protein PC129_g16134 [Phytophthora cactorum]|uniref:Uncharacterized protein n=1 Tax=Phytophthora cactorum TaxID=29920 RepID=A0A8T1FD97_9STRA|nr:hypothetical protein Pcac1_g18133 [Phytophthora cactorum]KAG2811817.1 hypothetical protein PC112_g15446 [Phytophthora cactorum]KAG2819586.1 hypothetical protein PC111_g11831 [Phytophthora cactorum]KAG2857698.1 hypothetical protein PC113_g10475 [Phytophthora cactorum]KAG2886201.1 hypothetical protein PC114_g19380 [Phytophthora cactorum]